MSLTDDYILQDTFPNGTRVRFSCNFGFTSAGGSPFITCSEGTWTAVKLKCESEYDHLILSLNYTLIFFTLQQRNMTT